jgi:hypothetical protein
MIRLPGVIEPPVNHLRNRIAVGLRILKAHNIVFLRRLQMFSNATYDVRYERSSVVRSPYRSDQVNPDQGTAFWDIDRFSQKGGISKQPPLPPWKSALKCYVWPERSVVNTKCTTINLNPKKLSEKCSLHNFIPLPFLHPLRHGR